ncbi:MAG: hypothetical protein K2X93_13280 [Candidatus Obscuribacterales bacterium]|nr:hypothetical protein [Candidatus Obscuribacterales bacterium]
MRSLRENCFTVEDSLKWILKMENTLEAAVALGFMRVLNTISDFIDLAEQLAPNNPDLPELRLLTADFHWRFALAKGARKLQSR